VEQWLLIAAAIAGLKIEGSLVKKTETPLEKKLLFELKPAAAL
jgi:hypothetical protein